jgi:rhodanese-related sulfurtransferase
VPFLLNGISNFDAEELLELFEKNQTNPRVTLIDVREPYEYVEGHIPGVKLIPMGTIPEIVDTLNPDEEYVFICRSGRRSYSVAKYLQNLGFKKVHNFHGGMLSWFGPIERGEDESNRNP